MSADPASPKVLLEFRQVTKRFGDHVAVRSIDLAIHQGEFFSLLGPSGCGKTTLLRMIAGFESPDDGQVLLDGEDLTALPAHRRPVNTVFQQYALFPHLDVFENVAFGLRRQGVAEAEIRSRVEESLGQVRLGEFIRRMPAQLSGGQKQRVALARALVLRPRLLLLDEPLGALDHQLRLQMQVELKQIQRAAGITFVFVTHDQPEALTMSDRIAVLSRGRIEQVGDGFEVYERPATEFVARFLGASNLLPARVAAVDGERVEVAVEAGPTFSAPGRGFAVGERVQVMLRPEWLTLVRASAPRAGWVAWPVRVEERIYQGAVTRWSVTGLGAGALEVTGTPALTGAAGEVLDDVAVGETARLSFRADAAVVLRGSEG